MTVQIVHDGWDVGFADKKGEQFECPACLHRCKVIYSRIVDDLRVTACRRCWKGWGA